MATDRERLLRNVFGEFAKVPPGPLSQLWWIWDPEIRELPYDSGQRAAPDPHRLDRLGRRRHPDKDGKPLAFRLLLRRPAPSAASTPGSCRSSSGSPGWTFSSTRSTSACTTSALARPVRRPPEHVEHRPDALVGFSPDLDAGGVRALQLHTDDNPDVDRLVDQAVASAANRDQARRAWRAAVETINRDAPAFPVRYLQRRRRAQADRGRDIRPDSWLALLRTWRIPADRLTDRDRVER